MGLFSGMTTAYRPETLDAEALQFAIWILMNETTMAHVPVGLQSDVQTYIDLAMRANWQEHRNVRS